MTELEQLRKEVNELRERLARLEAAPSVGPRHGYVTLPGLPFQPPAFNPYKGEIWCQTQRQTPIQAQCAVAAQSPDLHN